MAVMPIIIRMPWNASVYMTPSRPPKSTYMAVMAAKIMSATSYWIPRVVERNKAPPMMTADEYSGMDNRIRMLVEYCMNGERNLFPSRSGKVRAFSLLPIRRVGLPKTTNARRIPTLMFSTVSQMTPMPNWAATPPKPTMAEVEMNVAP